MHLGTRKWSRPGANSSGSQTGEREVDALQNPPPGRLPHAQTSTGAHQLWVLAGNLLSPGSFGLTFA